LDGKTPVSVTFTASTSAAMLSASLLPGGMAAVWFLGVLAWLPLLIERKKFNCRGLRILVRVVLLALVAMTLASCGGGGSPHSKTTTLSPSNDVFSLVFSGTTGDVTHSISVTLQVR
jgi:hypothetical protein